MKPKTIGIIGAGPVGGILGAHLLSAGHTVMIVDSWKDHIEHIRTNGLNITGREELRIQPAHLSDSLEALDAIAPEFVFFCTKACDLENVVSGISRRLKESETVFISAQNGIDTEQIIAERIERSRVLRAVISYAGNLVGPGEIRETFFTAPNYLGWLNEGGAESCRVAAEMVSASGLATEATGEIRRFAWRKSILNTCTMSIAAVTGMNMQEMVNFPPTAHLVELLLRESIAVAEANGYDYGPGFIETVRDFNMHAGPHRPSMLVDLENGRKTENGVLIRRIAEYGERKGVPVPLHRTMANLIDALEKRNLERSGSSPATARL
jgi:2-dehydropantoate 2-reductase